MKSGFQSQAVTLSRTRSPWCAALRAGAHRGSRPGGPVAGFLEDAMSRGASLVWKGSTRPVWPRRPGEGFKPGGRHKPPLPLGSGGFPPGGEWECVRREGYFAVRSAGMTAEVLGAGAAGEGGMVAAPVRAGLGCRRPRGVRERGTAPLISWGWGRPAFRPCARCASPVGPRSRGPRPAAASPPHPPGRCP